MLKKHIIYWILPSVVVFPSIVIYFFELPGAEIIFPQVNREYGILENLQLVILLGVFVVSILGARKKEGWEKLVFYFIALSSIFLLLEEMDYGKHFIVLFSGKNPGDLNEIISVHNLNKSIIDKFLKYIAKLLLLALFVLAPLVKNWVKNSIILHFIPNKMIICTATLTVLAWITLKFLIFMGIADPVVQRSTLGEILEVMIYYIFFLYIYEISRKQYLVINNS